MKYTEMYNKALFGTKFIHTIPIALTTKAIAKALSKPMDGIAYELMRILAGGISKYAPTSKYPAVSSEMSYLSSHQYWFNGGN